MGDEFGTANQVDFEDFIGSVSNRVTGERQEELKVFARIDVEAGGWDLECCLINCDIRVIDNEVVCENLLHCEGINQILDILHLIHGNIELVL